MNIAFIGYRTSGKTTLSARLAKKLGWQKIEIDKEIEKIFNKKITEIVERYGWKAFRITEKILIEKYSQEDHIILDLGGGAIMDEDNMAHVKKNSIVIFLDCSPDVLLKRLKHSTNRPALTDLNLELELISTLKTRMPLYKKHADITINSGHYSITKCAHQVFNCLAPYLEHLPTNIKIDPLSKTRNPMFTPFEYRAAMPNGAKLWPVVYESNARVKE